MTPTSYSYTWTERPVERKRATASPSPHPQVPVPPDLEFLRTRYPPPRDPGAITLVKLPESISITRSGD